MSQRHPQIKEVTIPNEVLLPAIVDLLNEGHTVTLRLRGNSMRPYLQNNRDCALLRKATEPTVGEPVLAEIAPGKFVFHRIIRIDKDDVVLQGDGNIGVERCRLYDVKAQTIGFYRKGRKKLETIPNCRWNVYSFLWTKTLRLRPYMLRIMRIFSF